MAGHFLTHDYSKHQTLIYFIDFQGLAIGGTTFHIVCQQLTNHEKDICNFFVGALTVKVKNGIFLE